MWVDRMHVQEERLRPALLAVDHHSPPDLMQARPSRLALRLRPEGGRLTVRGTTPAGPWQAEVLARGRTFAALCEWMYSDNKAYASARLREARPRIAPELLQTY